MTIPGGVFLAILSLLVGSLTFIGMLLTEGDGSFSSWNSSRRDSPWFAYGILALYGILGIVIGLVFIIDAFFESDEKARRRARHLATIWFFNLIVVALAISSLFTALGIAVV